MLQWTVHLNHVPNGDCHHAAVAVGNEVNGDMNDSDLMDVHVFNTVSLVWRELPPVTPGRGERHLEVPSCRWGHTAVLVL